MFELGANRGYDVFNLLTKVLIEDDLNPTSRSPVPDIPIWDLNIEHFLKAYRLCT